MFTITNVCNDKLKSIYLADKTFKVEIKYKDGTWKDITSYVEAIEINEQLTYDGNSPMNKAGISLSNINGEFSPAKVGAPFNEPVVAGSSRTFLTTKFPIRISVTANSTAYTIFRGYAHTVKDEGLKATIEAYDILYYLARKRYKKALSFANKTAKDIVRAIWDEVKSKIETDFGTAITLTFIPNVPTSKVLINTDAKTYLEALNKVVSGTGGYFNYRAFTNELIFVFMGDASYTNPDTANAVTFATANTINKFALEQQVDVANSVTVSVNTYVDKYNPPQTVDNWWYTTFVDKEGKFAPNNGIMMPAGSVSMFDIDFGKVGYDPEQTLVLTLYTYSEEIKGDGSKVYLAGGKKIITIDFGSNFSTAIPFDVSLSDWGTIRVLDYQIKAQGVWLKIQNNTGLNLSIAEARMRVKPLLESGKNTAEYKVDDPDTEVFVEQSIDTIFIDKSAMQKMAEAVLKLRGARITGEIKLSQFAPFLTVGGVVKVTLNDTNFNSTDVLLTEVKHTVRKGLCTTSFQFAHVFTLSTTVASELTKPVIPTIPGEPKIIGSLLPPTTFEVDNANQRLKSSIPAVKVGNGEQSIYKYFYSIDWIDSSNTIQPKIYTLYPQPSYTFTRNSKAYLPSGPWVDVNKPRLVSSNFGNLIEQYEPGASQDWRKWNHWNNTLYWYSTTQYDDPIWGKVFYGKAKCDINGNTYIFNYLPTISVTAGTTYTFSFYVKTSSNLTQQFNAYFTYGNTGANTFASTTQTYTLKANEWTRVEFQLTPSTSRSDTQYGVRFDNVPDGQEFWVAYPQLEAKPYILIEEGTTNLIDEYEPGASQDWRKWSHWNNTTYWYSNTQYDDPIWGKVFYGKAKRDRYGDTHIFNYSPTISVTAGTTYTFSFYIRTNSDLTQSFRAYFTYGNTSANTFSSTTKTYTLNANEWTRVEIPVTPSTSRSDVQYGVGFVNVPDGQEFWIAYPQLEAKPYATSFVNGTRANEELKIPAYNIINPSEGTIEMKVYVPDYTSYPSEDYWRKFFTIIEGSTADTTKEKLCLHYLRTITSLRVAWNNNGTIDFPVSYSIQPTSLAGYRYIALRWKAGQEVSLFIDGVKIATATSNISQFTITQNDYLYLGGAPLFWTSVNYDYANIMIDSLRISNKARDDNTILNEAMSGAEFQYDEYTTYLENFNSEFQYSDGTYFYIPLEYSAMRNNVTIWGEWTDGTVTDKTTFDISIGR